MHAMSSGSKSVRPLWQDQRGAAITEFGLVIPIVCTMMLGAMDFSHTLYMQSVLQGAVQKAARDSALETGTSNQSTIDTKVETQVRRLFTNSTITITRRYYKTFSKAAAAQAETFVDSASGPFADTKCNNSESYSDANNNSRFDRDGGDEGQGGAKDNVVYTVQVVYPRMFPLDKFIGGSGTTTVKATTVLSNQPFGDQAQYAAPTTRQCGVGTVGVDAPV
jgi:Flp pilus assembly protein TadG